MPMFVSVVHLGDPVDNASVVVYQENGAVEQRTLTAEDGKALLDVDEGKTYYLRASKADLVSITFSFVGQNTGVLDVTLPGEGLLPSALEGRCRIQGKVLDPLGNAGSWPLKISAFEGVARADEGVIYGDVSVLPNPDGSYDFDLVKNVAYIIHGVPDWGSLVCHVPDLNAISLQDFLFPKVVSIGNAPLDVELPLGAQVSYVLDVTLSNTLKSDATLLQVSSSSSSVQASIFNGYLVLSGVNSGASTVKISQVVDVEERMFGDLRGDVVHEISVVVP